MQTMPLSDCLDMERFATYAQAIVYLSQLATSKATVKAIHVETDPRCKPATQYAIRQGALYLRTNGNFA